MTLELSPGLLVGPYRLLFRLGKGGMGEVWAASQDLAELDFQKLVALKVLLGENRSPDAEVMFFDEAKAASALNHASIVQTNDLGRDGDILYIAMDLVEGPSLTALLQRSVINKILVPPEVVAHVGIAVGSALDYAYERATYQGRLVRLIHRDVSPHNVLLDLHGEVRLMDFGVARTAIQDHKSRVGTVRGKPSYMAPEQVGGLHIDARTDVFALGIVLYETSCLRRLFGRNHPTKSMEAVLRHTPRPLPEVVNGYPEALWDVIKTALEKKPADRFQSAGELADALREVTAHLPESPRAPQRLAKLIQKTFEPNEFDVDARVQAALANMPESVLEKTRAVPPPKDQIQILAKTRAWPSVDASDPLAPEAIEIAKTQLRPSGSLDAYPMHPPSGGFAPFHPSGHTPALTSSGGYTPATPSGYAPAPHPPQPSFPWLMWSLIAIVVMGIVAFGIAYKLGESPDEPTYVIHDATDVPLSPPVVAKNPQPRLPTVRPSERPTIAQTPQIAVTPTPDPIETPDTPPDTVKPAPPPRKARPRKPRPRTPPPPPPVQAEQNATYKEVTKLLRKVKAVDPARGKAMFATLAEAGRNNPTTLNKLRAEARRILASN